MYGNDLVTTRACERCFEKFQSGKLCVKDLSRPGRLTEIDTGAMKVSLDKYPYLTTRDIADDLQISQASVLSNIGKIGCVSRLDDSVTHALTEAQNGASNGDLRFAD